MIYNQIFDMVNIGIVVLDKDMKIHRWNRWMETHSTLKASETVGATIFEYFPDLESPWFERSCKSVLTFGNFSFFSQKIHKYLFPFKAVNILDAKFEHMQQSCTLGPIRNNENEIEFIYITVQDVTEITAYQQKLHDMNIKDGLTGAFNRRHFEEKLTDELDRHQRYKRKLSLIMLDIDFFKKVNDNYGHQAGDYLLIKLTSLIVDRIRSTDIFARYGGEEFCCILPETNIESAYKVAEDIRKIIEDYPFKFEDQEISITVSQGLSSLVDGIDSPEHLIKKADIALYKAKETGRNKVEAT